MRDEEEKIIRLFGRQMKGKLDDRSGKYGRLGWRDRDTNELMSWLRSEVKELEERLRTSEKMAILGQLSAGLAHELRNPLSAISGTIEVLKDDVKPSPENERLIRVATQEVERLNLLVEDFLILTMPIQTYLD